MLEKEKKIRICFVIDNLSRAGTETQLLLLLRSIDRNKVKPYLCILDGSSEKSRLLEPTDLPVSRLYLTSLISFAAITGAYRFLCFLRQNRIKIVQTYFTDATRFAAPIAKFAGCKILGSRRNIGHWMTARDCWEAKIISLFFIDVTIANCRAAKEAVVVQEKIAAENVIVIPNGIDLDLFVAVEEWKPPTFGEWRVGMVSNLRKVKGVDIFIRAAKCIHEKYPNAHFIIAGGGSSEKYQDIVDELGLTKCISFLGVVANVPALLRNLDVAVLPSRAEGMSGALLEYMAAGLPIVASAVGGNSELIDNERNGLLVEAEDSMALANAVMRYFSENKMARRCSIAAREDAVRKFSCSVLADTYTYLISTLISNKKTG